MVHRGSFVCVLLLLGPAVARGQPRTDDDSKTPSSVPSAVSVQGVAQAPPLPAPVPAQDAAPAIVDVPDTGSSDVTASPSDSPPPADAQKDLTPGNGAPAAVIDTRARAAEQGSAASAAPSQRPDHLPWIFTSLAATLGLAGAVVGLDAINKYDELEKNCARPCSESRIKALTARSLTADLLYAGAAASLITAVILFAVEDSHEESRSQPAAPDPKVALAPVVQSGSYGVLGQVRF